MYPLPYFASARDEGKLCTQCIKCRTLERATKQAPHRKVKSASRAKEKGYTLKSREKKRVTIGNEEYLKQNNERQQQFRDNNRDKVGVYSVDNAHSRYDNAQRKAHERGVSFDLGENEHARLISSDCFYCGLCKPAVGFHSVDRLDNASGYSVANCVSCCMQCNVMKGTMDPKTFIGKCGHIARVNGCGVGGIDFGHCYLGKCAEYVRYVSRDKEQNREFALTKDDYLNLTSSFCVYCRVPSSSQHTNGIDRIDSSKGHTIDNCVTCCAQCNYMKNRYTKLEFIGKCEKITLRCESLDLSRFDGIATCKKSLTRMHREKPTEKYVVPVESRRKKGPKEKEIVHVDPPTTPRKRTYNRNANIPLDSGLTKKQIPKRVYYRIRTYAGVKRGGFTYEHWTNGNREYAINSFADTTSLTKNLETLKAKMVAKGATIEYEQ